VGRRQKIGACTPKQRAILKIEIVLSNKHRNQKARSGTPNSLERYPAIRRGGGPEMDCARALSKIVFTLPRPEADLRRHNLLWRTMAIFMLELWTSIWRQA
jgi:hypothetical protein